MKKVFIICTVRGADAEYQKMLEDYTASLERNNIEVHLPHRDTNQEASGLDICTQNMKAIINANEVHVFYNPDSKGTHFDLGMAFALNKKLVIVEAPELTGGKSFNRMIQEWVGMQDLDYETNLPTTWNRISNAYAVRFILGEDPEMVTFVKMNMKNINGEAQYHVIEEDAYQMKPDGKDFIMTANEIKKRFDIDIEEYMP